MEAPPSWSDEWWSDFVVLVDVALAVADEDHSGHVHLYVHGHDLLRLSRDCGTTLRWRARAGTLPVFMNHTGGRV
jgi:hypothetical protein